MRTTLFGVLAAFFCLTCNAAQAGDYIKVGGPASVPSGWIHFCEEYKPECDTKPSVPVDVVLTPERWAEMAMINYWANKYIKPVTDMDHWGVIERWNYPDDGKGDCEDYALLKRRMLLQAGWPREALLITIVFHNGSGHAVLTVKTNQGEFILDNLTGEILLWHKTGYQFFKRQSQSDPNAWVTIDGSSPVVTSSK